MTTQITLSVLYTLEVDPPIVEFTHVWTKDEVSSALIPCPLPQDVEPAPKDVLIMNRSGVEAAQHDPVQRPDVVVPQQDSHVQCFVATMVQKIVVMSKQNRPLCLMRTKTNKLMFWGHIILCLVRVLLNKRARSYIYQYFCFIRSHSIRVDVSPTKRLSH